MVSIFFLQLGWLAHLSPGEHLLLFLCALILQAAGGDPLTAVCTWLCQSWIVFVDASGEAGFQLLDQAGSRAVVDPRGAAALGPEGQQGQPFVEFWYGWKRRGMLMERELFRRCNSPCQCLACKKCIFMYVCMYTSAYYYVCVPCRCLCTPKEGVRCLGAAVTSGCGLPDVSAGSHTWVLCEHIPALTTEPCLYLLMLEQAIERKTRGRPGLPLPGEGL